MGFFFVCFEIGSYHKSWTVPSLQSNVYLYRLLATSLSSNVCCLKIGLVMTLYFLLDYWQVLNCFEGVNQYHHDSTRNLLFHWRFPSDLSFSGFINYLFQIHLVRAKFNLWDANFLMQISCGQMLHWVYNLFSVNVLIIIQWDVIVTLLLSSRFRAFILDYLMLGLLLCKSSFVCVVQLWFKRCSLLVLLLSVHAVRDTELYQCCLLDASALNVYKTCL